MPAGQPDPLDDLHRRYLEQAGWTAANRERRLEAAGLSARSRLLEVGAGTGAVVASTVTRFPDFHALDLSPEAVRFGSRRVPAARWCQGDAGGLPYASGAFDAVLFHFTLLWLARPREALLESRRVTRAGGWILALAEPDHAARIDHPEPLVGLGELQTASLQAQGADITMGRQLASLFSGAGLRQVTTGLIGGEWSPSRGEGPSALEWDILRRDLRGRLPKTALDDLEKVDREAHRRGERVLFIPTFYASGQVP